MKKTKPVLLMVMSCLTIVHALAQKKTELKTKFGKLSAEEMKMSFYDKDPDAAAIILFDKASLDHLLTNTSAFEGVLERHVRLKIFKKEAYDYANIQIPHWKQFRITNLKASCYNLEGGKWIETKLNEENIIDESLDQRRSIQKFTIPQVREGSILEYAYTISQNDRSFLPQMWAFQTDIPTLWSEYEINLPKIIPYIAMSYGSHPFWVQDEHDTMESDNELPRHQWLVHRQRWVQKDVPALKTEPMMTSKENYRSRLLFQYTGFYRLEASTGQLSGGWLQLGRKLLDDEDFGDFLTHHATSEIVKSLTHTLTDPKSKVAAIYEHIGKNYQVKSYSTYCAQQPIKELLDKHKGSSTELNLLAINMLRKAGVAAYPVLMTTRSHGQLNESFPILERIDRVLIYLPLWEKEPLFLDMEAFPQPLGLLPFDDLNGNGCMIMNKEMMKWVPITNHLQTRIFFFNTLILNEQGELSGDLTMAASGYEAVKSRSQIQKDGGEKYVNTLFKELLMEGKLDAHSFENTDLLDEKPLKGRFKIQTTAYITKTDSQMYLAPMLFFLEKENLFKNPERKFDIDFGYKREHHYLLNLTIPKGYQVESLPKSATMTLNEGFFTFSYLVEKVDNQLKFNVKWSIKKTVFAVKEYPELRNMYETILNKLSEQIVFSKI